jgi:hypothetical protein
MATTPPLHNAYAHVWMPADTMFVALNIATTALLAGVAHHYAEDKSTTAMLASLMSCTLVVCACHRRVARLGRLALVSAATVIMVCATMPTLARELYVKGNRHAWLPFHLYIPVHAAGVMLIGARDSRYDHWVAIAAAQAVLDLGDAYSFLARMTGTEPHDALTLAFAMFSVLCTWLWATTYSSAAATLSQSASHNVLMFWFASCVLHIDTPLLSLRAAFANGIASDVFFTVKNILCVTLHMGMFVRHLMSPAPARRREIS